MRSMRDILIPSYVGLGIASGLKASLHHQHIYVRDTHSEVVQEA